MPAEKGKGKEQAEETTFKCKFCEETKPISEMTILPRYFPPMVACIDCSKKIEAQES